MANCTGKSYPFSVCVFHHSLDRARRRANNLETRIHVMHIGTATGVVRAAAIKLKTEPELFLWDVVNAVVGEPWKAIPRAHRQGDEVPTAMYPIADVSSEQPQSLQPAVRSGQGGVLGRAKSTSVQVWKSTYMGRLQVTKDATRS